MRDNFKIELSYIKDERLRDNASRLINLLPDYFFVIPASSTGKYHPSYASGTSGLVRHTKVVVHIGHALLEDETFGNSFTSNEQDLMIIAMIVHDGLKSGLIEEKYTRFDHPLLIAKYIKDNKDKLTLTDNEIDFLGNVLSSHMGPWTKDYQGKEVLPKPDNKYQKFVHLCDYLASKKFLNVNFDSNNDIEE